MGHEELPNPYQRPPRVVILDGLGQRGSATVVRVLGEHDYRYRHLLRDALAQIYSHVIIDLTWCSFLDSSVIAVILAKQTLLAADGRSLDVVVPAHHTTLTRTVERLGLGQLLSVHTQLPPVP